SAESFTVQISVADASADGGTAFGAAASLSVTDNDTAGLVIAPSPLSVPEKGMANYTVRLATQPVDAAATVTVTVSGSGTTVTLAPATLTFAATAWNTPQTVTVTAAEDAMVGDPATLMHAVAGMDEYNGIMAVDLTVNIVARPTTQATHDLLLPEVTRAVVGQQMQAIAGRVGTINGGGVGDSASFRERGFPGFAGAAAAHLQSLAAGNGDAGDGDLDAKELLRGLEFVMPLGASHGGYGAGVGDIAFWGGSDYRDFSGEDGDDDWDGSVLGLHFGVDGRVRDNLHAGLMVSYNDAETEYTRISDGTTDKGDYELDLTSVSPFLSWRLNGGNAWASVTYGSGEVEVKPDDGEASVNDVNMTGVAAGGSRRLLQQNGRELSLRADAFIAESEVEGDNDNATAGIDNDLDVDANRLRVALAWNYPQRFSDGRLTPAFDLGLRHDGGDGRTGAGLELGGALKFYAPAVGLTLEGNARALLGHTADHRAWGIGGLMRVESGADGQGLAVTVAPSYGGDFVGGYGGDGSQALWNGLRAGRTPADLHARLNAEVGYGMPAMGFGDAGLFSGGMLTPYSALRVGDASRDYRLGVRWSTGPRIALDLSARHINAATTNNAVTIEGRLRF
ncbi:MAG: autotransporter domain-containing protein, partial [Gammaproteobacteria bacterium]|nr:autotransporter domain-containing protein [Gammaproteobacteria bacterium]